MISVPYNLGRACDLGVVHPATVVQRATSTTNELDAVADVNSQLARAVAAHDGPPVVLARNCNSCVGTLAGLRRNDVGIIWFDAHGDFNTPETSITGTLEGMSLAIATGACHRDLGERIGLIRPVPEANVVLVATRSLDPEEAVRLQRSAVTVIPLAGLPAAIQALSARVAAVYLHLDMDVLDPGISPGVSFSAPGGIAPDELYAAIRMVGAGISIAAAAIANFNPDRDREGRTLRIVERLTTILAEISLR